MDILHRLNGKPKVMKMVATNERNRKENSTFYDREKSRKRLTVGTLTNKQWGIK